MNEQQDMRRLAAALLRYEQRCLALATEAVDTYRQDRTVRLALLLLPRQEHERHRRLALGPLGTLGSGAALWEIPRGMSAEVLQAEIARVSRDLPVLEFERPKD